MNDWVILDNFVVLLVFCVCKLKNIIVKLNINLILILIIIIYNGIRRVFLCKILNNFLISKIVGMIINKCWFCKWLVKIGMRNVIGSIVSCINDNI